jgi:hypothetical protein
MPNDKIDPLEGHVPRVTKNELMRMDFSAIVADAPAAVKLETDILLFERWQSQEAGRIRRENAQIHYAAAEKGIEPSIRRRRSTGYQGTITGRFSSRTPSFKNIDRTGRVYDLEPESDIERDRR